MPGWLTTLRGWVADASPLRRVMLALLVVLPFAALGLAWYALQPADYRVLYPKLSDRASGEVLAALDQFGIAYRLSPVDGGIEVPAEAVHLARYRLAAQGLPRSDEAVRAGEDAAPRFGATSQQEQQRLQRVLEQELARSVEALGAVERARVHLALPRASPFLRDAPPATAAVLVRTGTGSRLSAEQAQAIEPREAGARHGQERPFMRLDRLDSNLAHPADGGMQAKGTDNVRCSRLEALRWPGEADMIEADFVDHRAAAGIRAGCRHSPAAAAA